MDIYEVRVIHGEELLWKVFTDLTPSNLMGHILSTIYEHAIVQGKTLTITASKVTLSK